MPLTRVQATGRVATPNTATHALPFSTPPTVGNALIIVAIANSTVAPASVSCTDNQAGGNRYTSVVGTPGANDARVYIFYCERVHVSAAPFTVTITTDINTYHNTVGIEVGGLVSGLGLIPDQVASAVGTSTAASTGATPALVASEVFLVAAASYDAAQGSITVGAASPSWTQEFEELAFTVACGEVTSRIVTSAAGTTPSASWTSTVSTQWAAGLAAFAAQSTPATSRVSQDVIELLGGTTVVTNSGRITQAVVETLSLVSIPGAVTQVAVEVFDAHVIPAHVTQVAVEVFGLQPLPVRLTQAAVEVFLVLPPRWIGTPGIVWIEWRGRTSAPTREDVWETVAYSDWDLQCPPSYYHGFKAARVESFGLATRTLSDPRTGAWQGSSTEIRLSDVDRLFRTALEAVPQRFGADALVIVRMVSREVRAALGEPLTVFAGPIRRAEPAPPLSFALLLEDAVGHSMLTDELLIPQRQVEAASLPPTLVLAEAAVGHPVPILYGTHARETGAVAPVYLGVEGGTQHVWLVAGHYAAVTNVLLDGLSVLGSDGTDWTLPGRSGPLVEDYGGRRVTLLRGRVGTPPSVTDPVLYAENAGAVGGAFETWFGGRLQFGHLFPTTRWDVAATSGARTGTRCLHGVDLRSGDVAIGHFGATGAPGTAVLRGYAVNDYSALVLYVKSETAGWVGDSLVIRFSMFWDDDLEAAGVDVTLEDGAYGFDSFNTADYQEIEIPIADFEIPEDLRPDRLWIVKAGAGEDLSVLIDDISLIGGEETPGEQTPADRAAAGAAFAINVTGWTTTGDETGTVITDLYAQYQHFLITYVAHPAGYLTGGPLANPTTDLYDRVVQVIDESSFAVAAAQAVTRFPPTGYEGRGVIGATAGDRVPVREWIARWNLSADCRFGVSRYGELFVVLAEPTGAARDAAPLVEDVNDILAGSFVLTVGWESQATRVPYRAEYHWAQGTWLVAGRDAEDPALAAVYGRPAGVDSPVKDYWFVPTAAQGKNVAQHELARVGHPPRVLEFETHLELATAGLGGYLRVQHFAGVGPSEPRLVQIEDVTVAPGPRRVRIRGVDVTDLMPSAGLVAARSARLGVARVGLSRVGVAPEED